MVRQGASQGEAPVTTQHTKGPWYWNEKHQLVSATAKEYDWPADEDNTPKRIVETDGGHYPPRGADRALIAAAPDLLAALLSIMNAEDDEQELTAFHNARDVIKKATTP